LARESLLFEEWAQAYYRRKRAEGKTDAMAVRALSNQWVRLLYAMWSRREPYQRAVFLTARQLHTQPAA
jgi:hypothetical protein